MPFCNKCGFKLDPGDKFCFQCGHAVRELKTVHPVILNDQREERVTIEKEKPANNKKAIIITVCVIGMLLLSGAIFAIISSLKNKGPHIFGTQHFNFSPETQVGETIIFGSYEQDGDESNGKEEIEWIVLDKDGNKALIISKYGLFDEQFNSTGGDVTWDTSTLRDLLNGQFFEESFTSQEQKHVVSTVLVAKKHPSHISTYGTNSNDKVFILSIDEIKKYFVTDEDRKCSPAVCLRNRYSDFRSQKSGVVTCPWWTRSPGFKRFWATNVEKNGEIENDGVGAGCTMTVRPALWLDLGS